MAFFKTKILKNDLTNLIETDPNVSIEDILLHKDLSNTIRNESEILYKRILKNEDESWFSTILQYALFDKKPPQKYKTLTKHQINRNASNFLENCSRKFFIYFEKDQKDASLIKCEDLKNIVSETVFDFLEDEISNNPMYAGHFQRFFENFIRREAFDNTERTILEAIPFLTKKCKILAYQQLIMRLISDFHGSVENDLIHYLITAILRHSVEAVKYIRNRIKEDDEKSLNQSAIYQREEQNNKEKISLSHQPLNLKKEPIPLIRAIFNTKLGSSDIKERETDPKIPWKKFRTYPKLDSNVQFKTVEDAEIEAYLLIMSIRTSISEQTEIINYFRNLDANNNYPHIQALMYCGTRCGVKSLISLESFRLLSIIFNGSAILEISPWKSKEEEKAELNFYSEYANEMIFKPERLTYKMIHALPVFWNHRYNLDEYEMSEDEQKKVDFSDYYLSKKKVFKKREPGETALEILQPCLFCDPPISSQLIFTCQDIFIQLIKLRKELRKKKNKNDADRDEMVKLDRIVLDYYQHHFIFGKQKNSTLISLLDDIIPLEPNNPHYYNVEVVKRRASLSGFSVNFFLTMTSSKLNAFFENEECPVAKLCQCALFFQEINEKIPLFLQYSDCTHFETLSSNTIYNKPEHSDFYFSTNEEEEDGDYELNKSSKRKFVLVDEIDKKHHKRKKIKKRKIQKKHNTDNDEPQKVDEKNDSDN